MGSKKRRMPKGTASKENMKIKYDLKKSGLYIYLDGELDDCCGERVRSELDDLLDKHSTVKSVVFNMRDLSLME